MNNEQIKEFISRNNEVFHLYSEALNFIAKNLDGVLLIYNLSGKKWVFISPAVEKLRGYTIDETVCQNINEIFTSNSVDSIKKMNEQRVKVFKSKPVERQEYYDLVEALCKDGSTVKLELNTSYMFDKNGDMLLLGIAKKTPKQIPDENIFENEYILPHSGNGLLRTLIDQLPDRIFYKDKESRFIINNKAHIKALGKNSQEEVYGKTDFDFRPACDAEKFFKDDMQVIRTGFKIENKEELTVDISGDTHWCLVTKVPVRNANNDIVGLIGISRDITERKENEEAIKRQNEELKLVNAEKDKFFSIIAHDLRSPFQGFISLTKMMSEEYSSFSEKQMLEMNNSMHQAAINLYKLLENLLEWSNVKRGTVKFTPVNVNLCKVIKVNIELLSQVAINKGIEIISIIPPSLMLSADEKMIASVVRNLLSNAIKFTKRGGRVIVKADETGNDTINFSVEDTGRGIHKNVIDKLFKINEKINTEGTEGEPSTGLGLIICKEFIKMHNGTIKVESDTGKGSIFSVYLPRSL